MSWEKIKTKNTPKCRSAHLSFTKNEKIYIFGGMGLRRLNDFHFYDPQRNDFFEIKPNSKVIPPKVCKISGNMYKNKLFLFGGWKQEGKVNQMYSYDFRENKFELVPQNGKIPSERSAHSCFVSGNSLYLFGGIGKQKLNDMYKFNFKTNTWSQVDQGSIVPGKRSSYGGFHELFGKQCMICGLGAGKFNDAWQFSSSQSKWEKIKPSKKSKLPISRGRHSVAKFNNELYMFGGWLTKTRTNELWKFSIENKKSVVANWNLLKTKNKIEKREAHSANIIGSNMFVFGGWNEKGTSNEFFKIDLNEVKTQ